MSRRRPWIAEPGQLEPALTRWSACFMMLAVWPDGGGLSRTGAPKLVNVMVSVAVPLPSPLPVAGGLHRKANACWPMSTLLGRSWGNARTCWAT
jgi:hypothetical protein